MPRTRKTYEQQLAEVEKKKQALKAREADLKARKRAEERKQDTRRKVVVGAVALAHAEHDPQFMDLLHHILDSHVIRDTDRELLGLAPKPDAARDGFAPAASDASEDRA